MITTMLEYIQACYSIGTTCSKQTKELTKCYMSLLYCNFCCLWTTVCLVADMLKIDILGTTYSKLAIRTLKNWHMSSAFSFFGYLLKPISILSRPWMFGIFTCFEMHVSPNATFYLVSTTQTVFVHFCQSIILHTDFFRTFYIIYYIMLMFFNCTILCFFIMNT